MTERSRVLVIGAGAAGLSAAGSLRDDGHAVTVLEARRRLGGRVHTVFDLAEHPVELGGEFVQGENVCTWSLLARYGLGAIDLAPSINMRGFLDGKLLEQASFAATPNALLSFKTAPMAQAWLAAGGADVSLLEAAHASDGFFDEDPTPERLKLWNDVVGNNHCADLDHVGVASYGEATYDGDGHNLSFRVVEGYAALFDAMAAGLDIRPETPVRRIQWSRGGVVAVCDAEVFEADRMVVTLPLAVLQAGDVTFEPDLPAPTRKAIAGLGAGPAAKVVLRFDSVLWPEDLAFVLTALDTPMWWAPHRGRPDPAPVLTTLMCGSAVDRMRRHPDPARAALGHLEQMLDRPLADHLVEARWVDWGSDPWAKMGYSYVPPGATGLRAVLAEPVDDVLFFAGEAANPVRPATVHGAIASGTRAAGQIGALTGSRRL
jgi:monoamine oxidase